MIASSYFLKRLLDICGSAVAILLFSPIMLATWIVIRVEDPGPAIFKAVRIGRYGKTFTIYKFRSMVMNADKIKDQLVAETNPEADANAKIERDPRITKVG